jgi:hypothetical protein
LLPFAQCVCDAPVAWSSGEPPTSGKMQSKFNVNVLHPQPRGRGAHVHKRPCFLIKFKLASKAEHA